MAGALENVSDWQAKTMKIVERLWYEEGKLQERVEAELSSLKEDILGYGQTSGFAIDFNDQTAPNEGQFDIVTIRDVMSRDAAGDPLDPMFDGTFDQCAELREVLHQ